MVGIARKALWVIIPSTIFSAAYFNHISHSRYGPVHGAKSFNKVTHCIFDCDGTILDSETSYHEMVRTIISKYGQDYSEELQQELYGSTDREICEKVVEKLNLPVTPEALEKQIIKLSPKYVAKSATKMGVIRLLNHLHENNIPIALASNSVEATVKLYERMRPKLFGMFHHKVWMGDPMLHKPKPNPDIYSLTANRFDEPSPIPRDCLVFEDSIKGVRAAKAAGMQVVLIPGTTLTEEEKDEATLCVKSLREFKPELFGLPPFPATKLCWEKKCH